MLHMWLNILIVVLLIWLLPLTALYGRFSVVWVLWSCVWILTIISPADALSTKCCFIPTFAIFSMHLYFMSSSFFFVCFLSILLELLLSPSFSYCINNFWYILKEQTFCDFTFAINFVLLSMYLLMLINALLEERYLLNLIVLNTMKWNFENSISFLMSEFSLNKDNLLVFLK